MIRLKVLTITTGRGLKRSSSNLLKINKCCQTPQVWAGGDIVWVWFCFSCPCPYVSPVSVTCEAKPLPHRNLSKSGVAEEHPGGPSGG